MRSPPLERTNLALEIMHGIQNLCDRPLQGCRMGRRPPSALHFRPRTPSDGWAPCGGTPLRWPLPQGAAPLLPTSLPPSLDGRLMRSCPMSCPGMRPQIDFAGANGWPICMQLQRRHHIQPAVGPAHLDFGFSCGFFDPCCCRMAAL